VKLRVAKKICGAHGGFWGAAQAMSEGWSQEPYSRHQLATAMQCALKVSHRLAREAARAIARKGLN